MIFNLNYFNFTDNFIIASFAWFTFLFLSALLLWVLGKAFKTSRNSFAACFGIASYQYIALGVGVVSLIASLQSNKYETVFYLGLTLLILLVTVSSYFFVQRYFLLSKKKAFVLWFSWSITQVVILGGYVFISFLVMIAGIK